MPARPRLALLLILLLVPAAACAFVLSPRGSSLGLQFVVPKRPAAGDTVSVYVLAFTGQRGDAVKQWSVERNGATVRVLVETQATGSPDAVSINPMQVEIPALPAGTYRLEWIGIPAPTDDDFAIQVSARSGASVRPAEGFWHSHGRPGTGLYVQQRGSTIGLALLDQVRLLELGAWSVGSGTLYGNTAYVPLYMSAGGSCFDCAQHEEPDSVLTEVAIIDFESARRARIELVGGGERAVVSLPYGADYVPITLHDIHDAQFGPLPLPDLAGHWAMPAQSVAPGIVQFGNATVADGIAEFRGVDDAGHLLIRCASASAGREAGCVLLDAPAGATQTELAFATLGNVTESSMHFEQPGGAGFRAIRHQD